MVRKVSLGSRGLGDTSPKSGYQVRSLRFPPLSQVSKELTSYFSIWQWCCCRSMSAEFVDQYQFDQPKSLIFFTWISVSLYENSKNVKYIFMMVTFLCTTGTLPGAETLSLYQHQSWDITVINFFDFIITIPCFGVC